MLQRNSNSTKDRETLTITEQKYLVRSQLLSRCCLFTCCNWNGSQKVIYSIANVLSFLRYAAVCLWTDSEIDWLGRGLCDYKLESCWGFSCKIKDQDAVPCRALWMNGSLVFMYPKRERERILVIVTHQVKNKSPNLTSLLKKPKKSAKNPVLKQKLEDLKD